MFGRIKNNLIYLLIGLLAFGKGLIFFEERQFFFFPPQWTWLMNNAIFDSLMMLSGLALIIYTLIPYKSDRVLGIILALVAFCFVIIVGIEWEHVVFASQIKLKENIASNLFTIGIIFWTARHCDKR